MADDEVQVVAWKGTAYSYRRLPEADVPNEVRYWGLPQRWRGKNRSVEFGLTEPGKATWGAEFMRIIDHAAAAGEQVTYYRRVESDSGRLE